MRGPAAAAASLLLLCLPGPASPALLRRHGGPHGRGLVSNDVRSSTADGVLVPLPSIELILSPVPASALDSLGGLPTGSGSSLGDEIGNVLEEYLNDMLAGVVRSTPGQARRGGP